MATLQPSHQWSAATARSRLKHVSHEHPAHAPVPDAAAESTEQPPAYTATIPFPNTANTAGHYQDRLSEMEQRQLLLQTASIYPGWQLASMQHRPESDVLIAYLVRERDQADPLTAIREGRTMQIIMDAVGDLKVHHPRRRRESLWINWLRKLAGMLGFARV
jgi:hypothetical protein